MYINDLNPVAFSIFSLDIYWYSLSYIFGLLLGWTYCKSIIIKNEIISKKFDDYISYLIIAIIIGGRVGYIIIYNLDFYIQNPLDIFKIWKGGMSFHGALIGIIVITIYYSKKNQINSFLFLDYIALSSPIGIFFGRIANFINSELYGRETDVIWSVQFVLVDDAFRHPSQIYEALFEGLILFLILNILYKKKDFAVGVISSFFLIIYSMFRFIIEFTRQPDEQIGY